MAVQTPPTDLDNPFEHPPVPPPVISDDWKPPPTVLPPAELPLIPPIPDPQPGKTP
jgi:hypothetical protein